MIYIFSGYHFETARKCVNNNKGEVLQWKYEKTEKKEKSCIPRSTSHK